MKTVNVFVRLREVKETWFDPELNSESSMVVTHEISGTLELDKDVRALLLDESISIIIIPTLKQMIEKKLSLDSVLTDIETICSACIAEYGARIETIKLSHCETTDIGNVKGYRYEVDSAEWSELTNGDE